jgi:hypothetical protein
MATSASVNVSTASETILAAGKALSSLNAGETTSMAIGPIGKGIDVKAGDAGNTKDTSDSSTPAKANSSQTASNSSPTQGTQSGSTTQHAQPDAAQVSAQAAKPADASSLQTAPVHIAAQQQPVTGGVAAAIDRQPHSPEIGNTAAGAAGDGLEAAGTSGINSAKLIQTLSETQMQVGMRSAEFGDISIRTAVSQQQMVAQITVDHGELGRAILQHLPAAQTKLGDDLGVRAAIQVTHSGMSFSQDQSSASQQQTRSFTRPIDAVGAVILAETENTIPRSAGVPEDTDRLDIRA